MPINPSALQLLAGQAPLLTDVVKSVANDSSRYIGNRVLPVWGSGSSAQSGTILRSPLSAMLGDGSTQLERNRGADFPIDEGSAVESVKYQVRQYGRAYSVTEEDARAADSGGAFFNLRSVRAQRVIQRLMIQRERNILNDLGTWSVTAAVSAPWANASSDPMSDMQVAIDAVDLYGSSPNTIVIGHNALLALQLNKFMRDAMPTTGDRSRIPRPAIGSLLAEQFGVPSDRVFFASASANTANLGAAASISRIATNWVWVGRIETDSAPVRVGDTEYDSAPTALVRISTIEPEVNEYYDERSDSIIGKVKFEEAITRVIPQLGYLLTGI